MAFLLKEVRNVQREHDQTRLQTFTMTIWEWPAVINIIRQSGVISSEERLQMFLQEAGVRVAGVETERLAVYIQALLARDRRIRFEVSDEEAPSTFGMRLMSALIGGGGDPVYVEPGGRRRKGVRPSFCSHEYVPHLVVPFRCGTDLF